MTEQRMRIGSFAEAAGVSVDAVRFYERRGVLRLAPRTAGGFRTFNDGDLDRVRLARQLQGLGLTVEEVVDALGSHDGGGATCASERWRLERVEARIEAQMSELRRTLHAIRAAKASCDARDCQFATAAAGPE